jgi:hypothetical protein
VLEVDGEEREQLDEDHVQWVSSDIVDDSEDAMVGKTTGGDVAAKQGDATLAHYS